MNYEKLLDFEKAVKIKEVSFTNEELKGLIVGSNIGIKGDMTTDEKKCILAEELGHFYTNAGSLLDQKDISQKKLEQRARRWAINTLVSPQNIKAAIKKGCRNSFEIAEELQVTEIFLEESILYFEIRYGYIFSDFLEKQ